MTEPFSNPLMEALTLRHLAVTDGRVLVEFELDGKPAVIAVEPRPTSTVWEYEIRTGEQSLERRFMPMSTDLTDLSKLADALLKDRFGLGQRVIDAWCMADRFRRSQKPFSLDFAHIGFDHVSHAPTVVLRFTRPESFCDFCVLCPQHS